MKSNIWKALSTLVLAVVCSAYVGRALAQAQSDQTNPALAFEKLKTLAGHWEAKTDKGPASTTFELVSGGTALLERQDVPGHASEMITVYHLDGNRLILTHYCQAGNQPRMEARAFGAPSNEIDFDFVGATNLANPNAGHMHQVAIKFSSPDELAEEWTWYENGKKAFAVPLLYRRAR